MKWQLKGNLAFRTELKSAIFSLVSSSRLKRASRKFTNVSKIIGTFEVISPLTLSTLIVITSTFWLLIRMDQVIFVRDKKFGSMDHPLVSHNQTTIVSALKSRTTPFTPVVTAGFQMVKLEAK